MIREMIDMEIDFKKLMVLTLTLTPFPVLVST